MENKNSKTKKNIVIIILVILAVCIGLGLSVNSLLNKTNKVEVDTSDINMETDVTQDSHSVVNFLIVGDDNLSTNDSSNINDLDILRVVSLDYTDKKIKITLLDRDIILLDKSKEKFERLEDVYSTGDVKNLLNTINYNLDLDINKYICISFESFIKIIDKLGGIDVNLTAKEAQYFNSLKGKNNKMTIEVVEGINHLDGYNALVFSKQRKLKDNLQRMEKQNVVIKEVILKIKNLSGVEVLDLINECLPYISLNLTNVEILQYVTDLLAFDLSNVENHVFGTTYVKQKITSGDVVDNYSDEVIDLHNFIYGIKTYNPTDNIVNIEKGINDTFKTVE